MTQIYRDIYCRCNKISKTAIDADWLEMPTVHLLDYAAGNIRSLVNAIEKLGWHVEWIQTPEDVKNAQVRNILPKSIRKTNC